MANKNKKTVTLRARFYPHEAGRAKVAADYMGISFADFMRSAVKNECDRLEASIKAGKV